MGIWCDWRFLPMTWQQPVPSRQGIPIPRWPVAGKHCCAKEAAELKLRFFSSAEGCRDRGCGRAAHVQHYERQTGSGRQTCMHLIYVLFFSCTHKEENWWCPALLENESNGFHMPLSLLLTTTVGLISPGKRGLVSLCSRAAKPVKNQTDVFVKDVKNGCCAAVATKFFWRKKIHMHIWEEQRWGSWKGVQMSSSSDMKQGGFNNKNRVMLCTADTFYCTIILIIKQMHLLSILI